MNMIKYFPLFALVILVSIQSCTEPTAVDEVDPEPAIIGVWVLNYSSHGYQNDSFIAREYTDIGDSPFLVITEDSMAYWSNLCSVGLGQSSIPEHSFSVNLTNESILASGSYNWYNGYAFDSVFTVIYDEEFRYTLSGDSLQFEGGEVGGVGNSVLEFIRFDKTSSSALIWQVNLTNDENEPDDTRDSADHYFIKYYDGGPDTLIPPFEVEGISQSRTLMLNDVDWVKFSDSAGNLTLKMYTNTQMKISHYDSTGENLLLSFKTNMGKGLVFGASNSGFDKDSWTTISFFSESNGGVAQSHFLKIESINPSEICGNYGLVLGWFDSSF